MVLDVGNFHFTSRLFVAHFVSGFFGRKESTPSLQDLLLESHHISWLNHHNHHQLTNQTSEMMDFFCVKKLYVQLWLCTPFILASCACSRMARDTVGNRRAKAQESTSIATGKWTAKWMKKSTNSEPGNCVQEGRICHSVQCLCSLLHVRTVLGSGYDLRIWWFNSHSWVTVPKQDLFKV